MKLPPLLFPPKPPVLDEGVPLLEDENDVEDVRLLPLEEKLPPRLCPPKPPVLDEGVVFVLLEEYEGPEGVEYE